MNVAEDVKVTLRKESERSVRCVTVAGMRHDSVFHEDLSEKSQGNTQP